MGKNITVLGAGAWGTAFGQVLADAGNTVTMWAKEQQIVEGIRDHHHNAVRLPSVEKLPVHHDRIDNGFCNVHRFISDKVQRIPLAVRKSVER